MSTGRDAHLRAALRGQSGADAFSLTSLCHNAADVMHMDGATIVLLSDGSSAIAGSNERATALADLQFSIGEGPSTDAAAEDAPVSAGDVAGVADQARWPRFAPAASDLGAGSLFAFPLRVGAIRLGVLCFDRASVGFLGIGEFRDGLIVADATTDLVLDDQADTGDAGLSRPMAAAASARAVVHQASGMIAVQIGSSIRDALVRLRAHAYANDQAIDVVAALVVNHHLRFEADDHR